MFPLNFWVFITRSGVLFIFVTSVLLHPNFEAFSEVFLVLLVNSAIEQQFMLVNTLGYIKQVRLVQNEVAALWVIVG